MKTGRAFNKEDVSSAILVVASTIGRATAAGEVPSRKDIGKYLITTMMTRAPWVDFPEEWTVGHVKVLCRRAIGDFYPEYLQYITEA